MPRGSHITPAFDRRLLAVIEALAGAIPDEQVERCADFVRHGEEGLALDHLCYALDEHDVPVPAAALAEIAALGGAMGMDPRHWAQLDRAGEAPSHHRRTFRILGSRPEIDATALEALDAQEAARGVRFPAAVREWYSRAGAVDLLARHSNDDHPIRLAHLGRVEERVHGGPSRDFVAEGLLPVMWEHQHVCLWAVRLDGEGDADDPPVVVAEDLFPRAVWRPYADRFSDFVYAQVWDWPRGRLNSGVWAPKRELRAKELEFLRRFYLVEPATRSWPAIRTLRFSHWGQRQRISVIEGSDGRADWELWAEDADALLKLVSGLGGLDGLVDALRPWDGGGDVGRSVLDRLRGRR